MNPLKKVPVSLFYSEILEYLSEFTTKKRDQMWQGKNKSNRRDQKIILDEWKFNREVSFRWKIRDHVACF